ncbi:hypothetical protein AC249_AIPGENE23150 [Exaiptasia diaphana]|nr:hypothetical protein AC249_AIPGENE23150 [Exaiptasia diaphana]
MNKENPGKEVKEDASKDISRKSVKEPKKIKKEHNSSGAEIRYYGTNMSMRLNGLIVLASTKLEDNTSFLLNNQALYPLTQNERKRDWK